MERFKILEGRIYWPFKAMYHVTTWYSDGSVEESWENGPKLILPIPFNIGF